MNPARVRVVSLDKSPGYPVPASGGLLAVCTLDLGNGVEVRRVRLRLRRGGMLALDWPAHKVGDRFVDVIRVGPELYEQCLLEAARAYETGILGITEAPTYGVG